MKRIAVAALLLLAAGCGTAVYKHEVVVAVHDPAGVSGGAPVEVSIFDHQMGYSRDWAGKTMGTSTPAKPYVTPYTSMRTVAVGSGPRPPEVHLALSVPRISNDGYYLFGVQLPAEGQRDAKASFVRWGEYFPEAGAPMIPLRYRAEEIANGWRIFVDVTLGQP